MKKRGAYFFVIDAVIAGTVVLAALMYIFSTHSSQPESNPTLRSSNDFLQYISSTQIREYDSEVITNMTIDGNITNKGNTLLDQIVEFYQQNKTVQLKLFTEDVATRIIPRDRGLIIYVTYLDKEIIYNSTYHRSASTLNDSELVISSKQMSFRLINSTSLYGPVWVEAQVWV